MMAERLCEKGQFGRQAFCPGESGQEEDGAIKAATDLCAEAAAAVVAHEAKGN